MIPSLHSACRSARVYCLLTIGATILPLTLAGQTPGHWHVSVNLGRGGAHITPPFSTPSASLAERLLLDAVQRTMERHDKPVIHRVSRPVTAVVTANAGGDTVSLQVYMPTARRLAVAGDATDWSPVDMTRQKRGWWSVTLPFAGRVSRLRMQRDGKAWRPIPGLPVTRDEYGGRVSLLVVPDPPARDSLPSK